jgi:hypothetical protein
MLGPKGGLAVCGKQDVGMSYWTPQHLRIAVTPTGVVLLDLKRDRYTALDEADASQLAALAANWSQVSTVARPFVPPSRDSVLARVAAFMRAGLLSTDPPSLAITTRAIDLTVQLRSIGLEHQVATSLRPHHVLAFIGACLWARRAMRSRTLYAVACEISAAKAKARPSDVADVTRTTELVCIFRRLRPYAFKSSDQCLFHALALLNFLMRYGSQPTWVIGVCAMPWAAHSWLQIDDCILDSSPEDVCIFTPILAI